MADERNSADCRNWLSSGSKWPNPGGRCPVDCARPGPTLGICHQSTEGLSRPKTSAPMEMIVVGDSRRETDRRTEACGL